MSRPLEPILTNQTLPVVAGVSIPVDEFGRYNLNALHKAAGASAGKAPSQWLRNASTKELIEAAERCNGNFHCAADDDANALVKSVNGGPDHGTFAHEVLAVSYAGWISPSFQLQVNSVFLAYHKGSIPEPKNPEPIRQASYADQLAVLFESGAMSKRGAVRRFDAWTTTQYPEMAAALRRAGSAPVAQSASAGLPATMDMFDDVASVSPADLIEPKLRLEEGFSDEEMRKVIADNPNFFKKCGFPMNKMDTLVSLQTLGMNFNGGADRLRDVFLQVGVVVRGNRAYGPSKNKRRYLLTKLGESIGRQHLPSAPVYWQRKASAFLLSRGTKPYDSSPI